MLVAKDEVELGGRHLQGDDGKEKWAVAANMTNDAKPTLSFIASL
jgi:hypothetical protein